ncbi:MAG: hypothetical protein ACR2QT_03080 [Woeseiaceae bacterium]
MQCLRNMLWLPIAIAFALPVSAEDVDSQTDAVVEIVENVEGETLLELDAFDDSGTLSDDELNSQRAREDLQIDSITINDQDQDGDVTDNVAIGNTNGDNLINGEAFSNSSGFLSTVQNTGNNVLIQNSTIINVTVDTPTN